MTTLATILVVDDNVANVKLARVVLETAGYAVISASDGPSAIAALRVSAPLALILLDLQLPGADGLAVAQQMRREPATACTPIVMMTAYASTRPDAEVAARALGCVWMAKPVRREQLLRVVAAAIPQ